MTSRLGNTSLEQNIRLKASGYLLFIPAIFFYCLAVHDQFLAVIEKTVLLTHRVHPLLSAARWNFLPNFEKEGVLTRSQFLEGVAEKRG